MATFRTSDGVELFYTVRGRGRRVFALTGGPANDSRYLAEDLAPLVDEFEFVFHDYRGSGRSGSAPAASYTVERLSEDLHELRAELGDDTIVLLGHSMGGFVAQSYAGRFPDGCERLILAGTWPTTVPKKMLPPTLRALGWARSMKMAARALWWMMAFSWRARSIEGRRRLYAIWSTMQEGHRPIRRRELERERRLGLPMKNDNIRALQLGFRSLDFSGLLPAIECPTLVLFGERDVAALAGATVFRQQLRDVEIRALRDVGHDVFFEAPRESFDTVRRFLREPNG